MSKLLSSDWLEGKDQDNNKSTSDLQAKVRDRVMFEPFPVVRSPVAFCCCPNFWQDCWMCFVVTFPMWVSCLWIVLPNRKIKETPIWSQVRTNPNPNSHADVSGSGTWTLGYSEQEHTPTCSQGHCGPLGMCPWIFSRSYFDKAIQI